MCGIAGFYTTNNFFDHHELQLMTDALAHRGPDASGAFFHKSVALGHRRLSIIDLSEQANQPMFSENQNYTIVFNGEIYNYQEIAALLNFKARTTSDTEVVLAAFEKWGPAFVEKLNGMFAMAVYQKSTQKLFLFRDRIGIKPLFYYFKNQQLAFASELKALTKLQAFKTNKAINPAAINKFLHLGYIPAPETIYQHTYKFPKGSYAIFDGKNLTITPFWETKDQIKTQPLTNETTAKETLKNLIESSVKYRLIADVPYGTFLSGGIDSSLVTAVAQKVSNHRMKTFSIGFNEGKYNEAAYAKKVAQHLETEHHEYILSENEALDLIDDIWNSYDEPYADSSAIPTMLVSKVARQKVTMTLSGDGGDELFMGYGMYPWAKRLNQPIVWHSRWFTKQLLKNLSPKYQRAAHLFDLQNKSELPAHIFSQEQYFFSKKELFNISKIIMADFHFWTNPTFLRKLSSKEQQAFFDLNHYLPDDLLTKIDRAGMKYSLESRVPLLDHRIVEFALNLDESLKYKQGDSKYLLKQVLFDYVPKNYFDRPKWGFASPINQWLKSELNYLIADYLNEQSITEAGFVNYTQVKHLVHEYLNTNKTFLYNRIWVLIGLHKWYFDVYKNI